jgi:hypothetical protein
MDGKHQSPLQIRKSRRIKGFGENVGQLSLGVYVSHLNVPLLYIISQEVVFPLNISHLFVEDWIFATEMALVLSHMRGLSQTSLQNLSWCALSKESVSSS